MGMIINKNVKKFIVGFPTISDKYDVAGGTLAGTAPVQFGDLVKFSSVKGYYEAITGAITLADLAGFVVGTNVKLPTGYATNVVETVSGESFNLLVDGAIAVKLLPANVTAAQLLANTSVGITLADASLTTADKIDGTAIVALPNTVFTGEYETQVINGTTYIVAEILVK